MALEVRRLSAKQPAISKLGRQLRQDISLSQEKFAVLIGRMFPSINRWENGRATPSPLALQQIDSLLQQLGDRGFAQALFSQVRYPHPNSFFIYSLTKIYG